MKYTIDAKLFNAVNACAAVDDPRHYLNAFFIDAERNQIVGTNGHIMAIAPIVPLEDQREPEMVDVGQYASLEPHQAPKNGKTHGWLFAALDKPLGKSVNTVIIDTSTPNTGRLELAGERYRVNRFGDLSPVDGAYPDYDRAKADNGAGSATPVISLDSFYLARVAKWAHQETGACVLTFGNDKLSSIEVQYWKLPELHVTLMPCRL